MQKLKNSQNELVEHLKAERERTDKCSAVWKIVGDENRVQAESLKNMEEKLHQEKKTNEEICKEIGADKLIYQDLSDLILSVKDENPRINHFDTSCFNGEYVTGGVDQTYLDNLSSSRIKADV